MAGEKSLNDYTFVKEWFGNRLGPGEYYRPANGDKSDPSVEVARMWFLLALRVRAKEKLQRLVRVVGPTFFQVIAKRQGLGIDSGYRWPDAYYVVEDLADPATFEADEDYKRWFSSGEVQERIRTGAYSVDPRGLGHWPELQPEFSRFQMSFLQWLAPLRLTADWIIEGLVQALHEQSEADRRARRIRFGDCWERASSCQGVPCYSEEFVYTVDLVNTRKFSHFVIPFPSLCYIAPL